MSMKRARRVSIAILLAFVSGAAAAQTAQITVRAEASNNRPAPSGYYALPTQSVQNYLNPPDPTQLRTKLNRGNGIWGAHAFDEETRTDTRTVREPTTVFPVCDRRIEYGAWKPVAVRSRTIRLACP
jgi:hypothetical protein